MKETGRTTLTTCCSVAVLATSFLLPASRAAGQTWLSPVAIVTGQSREVLYIAFDGTSQVGVFDIAESSLAEVIDLPGRPSSLALGPGGTKLYVTCGGAPGLLCVIDTKSRSLVTEFRVGHTPAAVVLSPDGRTAYVCNRFGNDVWILRTKDGACLSKVSVVREPIAAALTPDGGQLCVVNHLPAGSADSDYVGCEVSIIDAKTRKVTLIRLPNGSTACRGVAISPDGKHAYVTHILARYTLPATQLERGWMNTNALSIIDLVERRLLATVLLDDIDRGAANPWAVTCTPDGTYIGVTHAGTHELSLIDAKAMLAKIAKHQGPQGTASPRGYGSIEDTSSAPRSGTQISNVLGFLYGIRNRMRVHGQGPRALAVVGTRLFVAEYFSDSLGVVDLGAAKPRMRAVSLGSAKPVTAVRKGRMLFHDATICFQGWQSCSSCHPDGRADALNWDLTNDGLGNPKNTKSLLLSHRTPPAMATGVRDSAEAGVRAGIKHILFAVRPESEAQAIDSYLKSLEPVPSPFLVADKPSEAVVRGQKLFEQAGCAKCHSGPLLTDLRAYEVTPGRTARESGKLDTPSLVEAWRTAPYLHDGRAAAIQDVLGKHNADDKHGVTSTLSQEEISDLAAFVLSQ